jgi:putative CocE/NonD family hydrolase
MYLRGRVLLAAALCLFSSASALEAAESYPVAVEAGVPAKMRDGTILRADIYRPRVDGQFPVLLERTPYNKSGGSRIGVAGAARGFVVIIQDVRGRYTSEGEFYTFKNESNDGYDSVEWAAALPYSNGKVGMFGGSYVGATQMLAAIAHPPHLAGICPVVTASNYHENWTYQGGAFEQWFNQSWSAGLAQDTLNRLVVKNTNAVLGEGKLPLTSFPLFNFTDASGAQAPGAPYSASSLAPYYLDWLAHPNYDQYWKNFAIDEHYGEITVPALTTAAWYDIFQGGSLRNYAGMKEHAGTEAARKGQHLLVIIGGHAGSGQRIGDVDFGPAAPISEDDTTLDWYDYLFKGVQNQFAGKPVRLFVMGTNEWRDEDDWPLARAQGIRYFLHSSGNANSLRGTGSLSVAAPGSEPHDHYLYDPSNPVPTTGGPLCCDGGHLAPGPKDQRAVEARDDVLVYSTPPFARDTEITGPISLELYAESSAVDTDFTAKLVDVGPDGFAQDLTEGIVRAKYRDSREAPSLLNPGQVYKFSVDMWSTSNVFRKGHVLRLEVSSSNFPRFDRNMNTGEDGAVAQRYVPATNAVYHDAAHPSALILPVIPPR